MKPESAGFTRAGTTCTLNFQQKCKWTKKKEALEQGLKILSVAPSERTRGGFVIGPGQDTVAVFAAKQEKFQKRYPPVQDQIGCPCI